MRPWIRGRHLRLAICSRNWQERYLKTPINWNRRPPPFVITNMRGTGHAGRPQGQMICRKRDIGGALALAGAFHVFGAGFPAYAQGTPGPGVLPPPSGRYAVGRVTLHWTDRSRVEPLAADRPTLSFLWIGPGGVAQERTMDRKSCKTQVSCAINDL